jgi:hypothetical protein
MHCKDCIFNVNHVCENEKLSENHDFTEEERIDMLIYSYQEGGRFEVGDLFGCIHFDKKVNK